LPYVPNTDRDREEMLAAIGAASIDELFPGVPAELRLQGALALPGPMSELEVERHVRSLAALDATGPEILSFLGAGVYAHAVPSVVRHVTSMPQFATAYTPYQAEASQGTLQSIYEFQSLIARLTGLPVANASLYDGASAVAEAALLAIGATRRSRIVVSSTVSPRTRAVLSTYTSALDVEVIEAPAEGGATALDGLAGSCEGAAAVVVQHPNFFGLLEPVGEIVGAARAAGALSIASVDPISLAVLKCPGDYGFDIAVGEGQSLGSPPGFGGPLLGFMATTRKHLRRLPGRVIGATTDAEGRRGYVMTLQTREQHIRREKATSNICTNQALSALAACVYLSLLGSEGLRELAVQIASKAHYAASALGRVAGVGLAFERPFFREFVVRLPVPAEVVVASLAGSGIRPGIGCGRYDAGMEDCLLVSVTERHTRDEIDTLASAVEAAVAERRGA
jgi:glycine dehydrogenase subunit 1